MAADAGSPRSLFHFAVSKRPPQVFAPVYALHLFHRGLDDGAAFAEADAGEARALAVAAEDHFIAILEKPARLAGRQRDRLAAAFAQLQEARPTFRLRA